MIRFLRPARIPDLRKGTRRSILYFFLCFILLQSSAPSAVYAQGAPAGNEVLAKKYNDTALRLMSVAKYDESIEQVNLALQQKENAESYYYRGHIHRIRNDWQAAVDDLEKATRLAPASMPAYADLCYSYIKVNRLHDALAIRDKAIQGDPQRIMGGTFAAIDDMITEANHSRIATILLCLILATVFFMPLFRASKDQVPNPGNDLRFSEVLLISATVSCVLYSIFFAFSGWIWSKNLHVPTNDYAGAMRIAIFEHDGVESFLMYVLVFVAMLLTLLGTLSLLKLRSNKSLYQPVFIALLVVAVYYFFRIGFYPPFPSMDSEYAFMPFVLGGLGIGLYLLYQVNSLVTKIAVVALAAFAGLVTLAPPSLIDLAFILDPALRLFHGFKVTEIYFQYDLFLSFLAYAWMKMNFAIEWFPYVGPISFFLFFIGIFFFSDKFFKTKGLSVVFIIALMVARLYMISFDNQMIIQVSPLRLDLWLIILIAVYFKGIHHWLVGLAVGLIVIFHRNLGLIYLGAYAELLILLFVIDAVGLLQEKNFNGRSIAALVMKHLRLNAVNLGIIVASIALCFILFKELFSASALVYRQLGIGMLPVSKLSFYWYVPVLLGCAGVFLFYYRNKLGPKYVATGLFILLLTVGNSMYFFGRSHENNILNIMGILTLALFVMFDMLIFLAPQPQPQVQAQPQPPSKDKNKKAPVQAAQEKPSFFSLRNVTLAIPFLTVILIGFYYSERTFNKAKTQYDNLVSSNLSFSFASSGLGDIDTAAIRQVTHGSSNVYFIDERHDFYYYYFGNYKPLGYYSPFGAFVYKKDILTFVQDLLDKGYYIVFNVANIGFYSEYLPVLRYNQSYQKNAMIALKKEEVPYLLSKDAGSLIHIAIKDSLAAPGLDYKGLDIKGDFTVEVILKTTGAQVPTASVINNLSQFANEGLRGITFQHSSMPGQFLFAFSNGTTAVPNVGFTLEDNVWHYVVATVNKETLKVYVDGKLAGYAPSGGAIMANSELPLTIGNRNSRDCHFNGLIREVKITNGNKEQGDIMATGQTIITALNNNGTPAK